MNKRIVLSMLMLCMCASVFTACGAKSEQTDGVDAMTETEVIVSESETPTEDGEYVPGTVSETGYVSDWMGLVFNKPEGMKIISQEELHSRVDAAGGNNDNQTFMDNYAQSKTNTEMSCDSEDMSANLTITVEDIAASDITEEEYLSIMGDMLLAIDVVGVTYSTEDVIAETTIGGEKYVMQEYSIDSDNTSMKQLYCIRKKGDRMISMIFTYVDNEVGYTNYCSMKDAFAAK